MSSTDPYRRAYTDQKAYAKRRGVGFKLTFEQWLDIWVASGKLHLRGRGALQYCMARKRDRGAYKLGNVKIITNRENSQEAHTYMTKAQRALARAASAKGGRMSGGGQACREQLIALNRSRKGIPLTTEHKQAVAAGLLGNKHSEATKKLMSVSRLKYLHQD